MCYDAIWSYIHYHHCSFQPSIYTLGNFPCVFPWHFAGGLAFDWPACSLAASMCCCCRPNRSTRKPHETPRPTLTARRHAAQLRRGWPTCLQAACRVPWGQWVDTSHRPFFGRMSEIVIGLRTKDLDCIFGGFSRALINQLVSHHDLYSKFNSLTDDEIQDWQAKTFSHRCRGGDFKC